MPSKSNKGKILIKVYSSKIHTFDHLRSVAEGENTASYCRAPQPARLNLQGILIFKVLDRNKVWVTLITFKKSVH